MPYTLGRSGVAIINADKFLLSFRVNKMLNKNVLVQKKARPIRSSSYLTTSIHIAILVTKNFDIKVRPRIS